jgi:hypothetical protein
MLQAQGVDGMRAASRIQHKAREHRVVCDTAQLYPGSAQNLPLELDVVPGLRNVWIGQERIERGAGKIGDGWQVPYRRTLGRTRAERTQGSSDIAVAERQIPDLLGAGRERKANQLTLVRLRRGGLSTQSHNLGSPQALHQSREFGWIVKNRHRGRRRTRQIGKAEP